MTLREFAKLEILTECDVITLSAHNGCEYYTIDFDYEVNVGNIEKKLKDEVLDTEISYVQPFSRSFYCSGYIINFKEAN